NVRARHPAAPVTTAAAPMTTATTSDTASLRPTPGSDRANRAIRGGRPKGSKNIRKAVEEIFTTKLTVREGRVVRRITKIEACLLTQLNQALKGNQRAAQGAVATVKELGLLDARPDKIVMGDLSSLTDEELMEFERLLEKASAKRVPH